MRSKWFKRRENVAIGDIVLVIDKDVSRSKWNVAIVERVYPGKDRHVRNARVRTSTGTYDRTITRLTLLPSKEEQLNELIVNASSRGEKWRFGIDASW